jgi:DNA-binding MurR/RpiR family transcriptional regulator
LAHVPATYSDLKAVIAAEFNGLPRQLKKFGRFVLDNSDTLALETVTTVAERADVQPSTIIRFAKAIGHEGFSDLQQICRSRLMEDTSSYRDRISAQRDRGREGTAAVLDEFSEAGIKALEHLRENIPDESLEQAVSILQDARDIYLLAQGRSYAVAQYLHYALSRLEIRCHLADGAGGMLNYQVGQAGVGDAVIAISFTPYTPTISTMVTELAERGTSIISITDSPLSPLAKPSDISLEITESSDQSFRTLVAPICLAQSLVVSLGQAISKVEIENEQ